MVRGTWAKRLGHGRWTGMHMRTLDVEHATEDERHRTWNVGHGLRKNGLGLWTRPKTSQLKQTRPNQVTWIRANSGQGHTDQAHGRGTRSAGMGAKHDNETSASTSEVNFSLPNRGQAHGPSMAQGLWPGPAQGLVQFIVLWLHGGLAAFLVTIGACGRGPPPLRGVAVTAASGTLKVPSPIDALTSSGAPTVPGPGSHQGLQSLVPGPGAWKYE